MTDRINRRDYLQWVGVGGAALLAGCMGSEADADVDVPDEGDNVLIIAEQESPGTMNPFMLDTFEGFVTNRLTHSALTWTDSEFNVQPDLAVDWESNEAADQWTFELREGVTFNHNGNEVLAEDVKASIDKIQDPDTGSPGRGSIGPIESTDVISDHAVQFNLSEPFSQLPLTLSFGWAQIVERDAIENRWDEIGSNSFGSGPFELEEFTRGEQMRVTAADDFYFETEDGEPLPLLDGVTQVIIPDSSARTNALEQGDVDLIRRMNAREFDRVDGSDGVETVQVDGGRAYPIIMNHEIEPFDDNRVRQAVKYAINGEEIMQVAQLGAGVVGESQTPIGPANFNYADDLEPDYGTTAEVEQARELLEDAGYGDGIELDFPLYFAPDFATQIRETGVLVQEQLGEVGIEFDLQEVTWDNYLAEVEGAAEFYVGTHPMWAIERQAMFILLHQEGSWNGVNWDGDSYDAFEAALDAALSTADEAEVEASYAEAQQQIHEHAGYVIPFFADAIAGHRGSVQGFRMDPEKTRIYAARGDSPISIE